MDANLSTPEDNMRILTEVGLERWLKARRDEWQGEDRKYSGPGAYHVIDSLLNEVRESGAEGFLPWEREL